MLDLTLTANGLVFAGVAALQTTVDLKRVLREIRGCKSNCVSGHRTILPMGGNDDQTHQETRVSTQRAA